MRPHLLTSSLAALLTLATTQAKSKPTAAYTPATFSHPNANTVPWIPTEKAFSQNPSPTDNLWQIETIDNTTYATAAATENPPILRTTLSNLTPHQFYQIHAHFIDGDANQNAASNHRISAGLSPYSIRTFYGDYLSPNPQSTTSPPARFAQQLHSCSAPIGSIRANAAGEIHCYIAPSPNKQSQPTTYLGLSAIPKPSFQNTPPATTYHISPNGDDSANGSAASPWKTFQGARDQLRKIRQKLTPTTVMVHAGTYQQTSSLELSEADSFIHFRSAPNECATITGGITFSTALTPVTDPAITSRILTPNIANQIYQLDLSKLTNTSFNTLHPYGFGRPVLPQPSEIYIDQQRLSFAQYPNAGTPGIPIGKVTAAGEKGPATFHYDSARVDRWQNAENPWIKGYFAWGYSDDMIPIEKIQANDHSITTKIGHSYGFKPWSNGTNFRRFYGVNLLEEIDTPRECWVNPSNTTAYLIPPIGSEPASVTVSISQLETPVVSIQNATQVTFDGIDFALSRGPLVRITNGNACSIQNASLSKAGNQAVHIASGTKHHVTNCVLNDLGSGGVLLEGGDLANFAPAHNRVDFCEISDVNRHELTYRGAVNTNGFGNHVTHCLIHTMPQMAILATGSHQEIAYNEITHAFYDAGNDSGTIYQGRSPIGYNHIHHNIFLDCAVGSPFAHDSWAVYLDDGYCGANVSHNTFIRSGLGHSIFVAGGSQNTITHNHFIDSASTVRMDNRLQTWAAWVLKPGKTFDELLKSVNYQSPPWVTQHPELKNYWQNNPAVPKNTISENTCLRSKPHQVNPAWWKGTPDTTTTRPEFPDRTTIGPWSLPTP